eukprot:TRINITY_DN1600_c0_g1_i1.p1 TRINITY_DN1600_c0_g1~~TRINITY_DN1600_c0_g1_i1.p1  ORF type:complete len:155 (-),score=13.50 TRINITY_DN1600_c0_g1_i1:225-689(-)
MAKKMSLEVALKVPESKVFEAIKDSINVLPKAMPSFYDSIQVIEGDGRSPGSVRLVKYTKDVPTMTFSKERLLALDEGKMSVAYEVIEGEMLNLYKSFRPTVQISPGSAADSCIVKWSVEYEGANAQLSPPEEPPKDSARNTFKAIEQFLVSSA